MFENEIIDCIRQYCPKAEILHAELFGRAVHVHDKKIIFHLLPVNDVQVLKNHTYFQEKTLEYASQGIQLVHLWQDCWVAKQAIVRSRIAALSGSFIRIHARQTEVRRVTKDVAFHFFTTVHMQGFVNGRYHYGLYCDGRLVAMASFSAGRQMLRNSMIVRSFELLRYANLLHHRVTGGLGKLIARFVTDVRPDDIMTYSDLDWGTGNGYRTLNFEQIAVTQPQTFWIHPLEMIRYCSCRLPHQLTDEFQQQEKHGNIDDFLKNTGYVKIYNAGNLKYLLCIKNLTTG